MGLPANGSEIKAFDLDTWSDYILECWFCQIDFKCSDIGGIT